MDQERAALAALATRITIGQRTVERLRAAFGSLVAASRASLHALRSAGIGEDRVAKLGTLPDGAMLLAAWERRGLQFLAFEDAAYPDSFRTLACPPAFVLVEGDPATLSMPLAAIIGTRKATPYGKIIAERLVTQCRLADYGTVAGLALGIDTTMHQACVRTGVRTVAVLAGGHDKLYPSENAKLVERIIAGGGAVISEVVPETLPFQQRFIARNRLVAALGRFVTVVQAGEESGTLNTVMHAQELGRDVVAVPGEITVAASRGCAKLLENGAIALWRVEDFAELLRTHNEPVDPIVREVRRGNGELGDLAEAVGMTIQELSMPLLYLEMQGAIWKDAQGVYRA